MKPNIKKLLILNAPYLLFVWLFMKIGEAFRLSPGADLSGKLLHIMEGVTAAFESPCRALTGRIFLSALPGRLLCGLPSTQKAKTPRNTARALNMALQGEVHNLNCKQHIY